MATTIVDGSLNFSFPEIDQDAILHITFHRTLRVPDDATTYGLPPGLGEFDLRQVGERDDFSMPMWQAEASWIGFSSPTQYPFLIKVGVGGVNAITGDPYSPVPDFGSEDYLESDTQPWLDGFRVDDTTVRQFVAMLWARATPSPNNSPAKTPEPSSSPSFRSRPRSGPNAKSYRLPHWTFARAHPRTVTAWASAPAELSNSRSPLPSSHTTTGATPPCRVQR